MPKPKDLWESEIAFSDAIGRLIEFWGFKRNMGRVWALLYLSEEPLTAKDLGARLQISAGAVSMTVTELIRWGAVRKVWIQGQRKDHFAAEGNLWKMITRVIAERERVEILEAIDSLESALDLLEDQARTSDIKERNRAKAQREKIRQILELARMGRTLVDALVQSARVDASPLVRVLLGSKNQ